MAKYRILFTLKKKMNSIISCSTSDYTLPVMHEWNKVKIMIQNLQMTCYHKMNYLHFITIIAISQVTLTTDPALISPNYNLFSNCCMKDSYELHSFGCLVSNKVYTLVQVNPHDKHRKFVFKNNASKWSWECCPLTKKEQQLGPACFIINCCLDI